MPAPLLPTPQPRPLGDFRRVRTAAAATPPPVAQVASWAPDQWQPTAPPVAPVPAPLPAPPGLLSPPAAPAPPPAPPAAAPLPAFLRPPVPAAPPAAWPSAAPQPLAPAAAPAADAPFGLLSRVWDWLKRLLHRPAPPPPVPQPPLPGPVPPGPAPGPTPTPGVRVYFTNAYASPLQGLTSAQVREANQRTTQADPNNPDRQLAALIDSIPAGGTLDGSFFSIGVDTVVDALVRAQQRGVRLRLVTERDYYQTPDGTLRPAIAKLRAAGVPILPDDRGALMHNKFLVANGQTVWTGSYNITPHGSYEENNNAMRIDSPALAAAYTHEFAKMYDWLNFGPDNLDNANPYDDHPVTRPIALGNGATVEAYFSPYRTSQAGARGALLDAIRGARKGVEFLAFSFTDDGIGDALLARAAQGVKVSGVFEKSQAASRFSEYKRLNPQEASLGGNLDVRIDTNPSLMHHKVMIIDDATLVMGSFNFSQSAQGDNNENMLIFRNAPDLVAAYRAEFRRIQAISVE